MCAGPLQDLRSMLQRFARPWRPNQLLHVGLINAANKDVFARQWGKTGRVADLENQVSNSISLMVNPE